MERETCIHSLSWNMMHYDWMNVLQICTWAIFLEHWYPSKMDRCLIHNLHSCDKRKYKQPCVSGLLCCALSPGIRQSFHLCRALLTMSMVETVWLQSGQYIMPPLTLSYNSLCLAQRKWVGSFSLNSLSAIPIFNCLFSSPSMHLWVMLKSGP